MFVVALMFFYAVALGLDFLGDFLGEFCETTERLGLDFFFSPLFVSTVFPKH